jgi:NADP-dependent 3-hydroxy acid dehydrogenase YdfG
MTSDEKELTGTVALVTGASSGIGEATALALADLGATVAIAARRKDRLDDLAQRITTAGGTALAIEADVGDQAAAQALIERTVDELGRLDTLVNNAGVMLLGPAVDAPLQEWEQMLSVNVEGLLWCAHAALPHLLRAAQDAPRRIADMVNVSSVAGRTTRNGSAVYNLTKHGIGAFSEALRQEVTGRHVRISLVEPGAVDTELRLHNRPEIQENMQKRFGDMELLHADDIASAVSYIVTRPWRMSVNEILVRPTEQDS